MGPPIMGLLGRRRRPEEKIFFTGNRENMGAEGAQRKIPLAPHNGPPIIGPLGGPRGRGGDPLREGGGVVFFYSIPKKILDLNQ